jgi:O-antigen ligase
MLSIKKLQENHLWFFLIYTLGAISVISVFRHGTTLLYFVLWGFLFFIQPNRIQTLNVSADFAKRIPFVFLTLLMLWGLLSITWSIHPLDTLKQSLANLLTFVSFSIFFAALIKQDIVSSKQMITCMIVIFVASFLLLMTQALSDLTIRHFLHNSNRVLKPNAEVLAILVLPIFAYFMYRKRYLWGALFYFAALALTYVVQIRTSFIALVVGALAAVFYYALPRLTIWITTASSIIYVFVMPVIFSSQVLVKRISDIPHIPESFVHRFYIWTFVAEKIKEKPWLGWGINVSHNFPGCDDKIFQSVWMAQLPSHPHNEVMQIWLEQGLIGAILLACFHGSLFWQVRKVPDRLVKSMYGFYLVSSLIVLAMSHSLWHKWWITWIALCGGLLIAVSRETSKQPKL